MVLIKSHFSSQKHPLLWLANKDFKQPWDKNKMCLTACGCWQRWLYSRAYAGIRCRTCRSMRWIIRDRACVTQSCSHAGLSGVEETRGAVALRVLCGVGSWGVGCVHGRSRGKQELWGGRHTDVSWEKRISQCWSQSLWCKMNVSQELHGSSQRHYFV